MDLLESKAEADLLDISQGPGPVIAGADENGIRLPENPFVTPQGIIGPVEKVFDGPGHIAEVFRRADHQPVAGDQILFGRISGFLQHGFHSFHRPNPSGHRFGHGLGIAALGMKDNQDLYHALSLLPHFIEKVIPIPARYFYHYSKL